MLWKSGLQRIVSKKKPGKRRSVRKRIFVQNRVSQKTDILVLSIGMGLAYVIGIFLITTGEYNGTKGYDYSRIRQAQLELAREYPEIEIVCDDFHTCVSGLMKDEFHYYQKAYNEVGTAAGNAAGEIVNRL